MKILISTGYYNTKKFAGINTGINIAASLQKLGCECVIVGETYEKSYDDSSSPVRVIRLNSYPASVANAVNDVYQYLDHNYSGNRRTKLLKYTLRHPLSSILIAVSRTGHFNDHLRVKYARKVERIINQGGFDAVICVCYPFDMSKDILRSSGIRCCKVYYQLDPYGTNYALPPEGAMQRKKDEADVMLHSDISITTNELYEEYSKDPAYQEAVKKAVPMEFPAYFQNEKAEKGPGAVQFNRRKMNLLYCGTLPGNNVRDTRKAIEVFQKYLESGGNPEAELYLIGDITNEGILKFAREHEQAIHILPEVSQAQALATMEACDFLVNIGNTIPNMVPSKIFTYFATGKPIISFETSRKSAENRYFDRYPAKFMIYNEDDSAAAASSLGRFLSESKGRQCDTEEIRRLYEANTTDYVAGHMLALIQRSLTR